MINPQDYGLYILILGIGEDGRHVCAVTQYFQLPKLVVFNYGGLLQLSDFRGQWGSLKERGGSGVALIMDILIDEESHL